MDLLVKALYKFIMNTFILIGTLLVVNFFLGYKCWKLWKQNKNLSLNKESQDYLIESIRILSLAHLQEQVIPSEACLRLRPLIDHLLLDELSTKKMRPLFEFYEEIKDFPVLENRLNQSKTDIFNQDLKRLEIEAKYEESFKVCCEFLYNKFK